MARSRTCSTGFRPRGVEARDRYAEYADTADTLRDS